jgi:hypothetical protein
VTARTPERPTATRHDMFVGKLTAFPSQTFVLQALFKKRSAKGFLVRKQKMHKHMLRNLITIENDMYGIVSPQRLADFHA